MSFYVYLILSHKNNKYTTYVGYTSNIVNRIKFKESGSARRFNVFFNQFKGEKNAIASKKIVSSFKAFVFRCRAQKVSLAPKSWNIHQEEQIDWLLALAQEDPSKLSG